MVCRVFRHTEHRKIAKNGMSNEFSYSMVFIGFLNQTPCESLLIADGRLAPSRNGGTAGIEPRLLVSTGGATTPIVPRTWMMKQIPSQQNNSFGRVSCDTRKEKVLAG